MYCRKCGNMIADHIMFCPYCGEKQYDNTPATVFCRHCGSEIDSDCIICPRCGKQVKELTSSFPNIIINNENQNVNSNTLWGMPGKLCQKWVAFFLCFFFGFLGAHKFYEGKILMGIIYLFTAGFFGVGWLIDTIIILFKPNPYFVYR